MEITELKKAKEDLEKDLDMIGNELEWYKIERMNKKSKRPTESLQELGVIDENFDSK